MPLTRIHENLLNRRYWVAFGLGLLFASALAGQHSQFQGSVPTGTASSTPLALTLRDAIARGNKANLGLLVSDSASESARGQRLRALSALLPQVTGGVSETVEQLNLKTIGFTFSIPGVALPSIVGPFHYTDVRASASATVFDYNKWKNYR
jgi:outer membrane protein TolC